MFEITQIRGFRLTSGTAVSLVLHACFLPVFLWAVRSPKTYIEPTRLLNIEVNGLHANRQTAALQKQIVIPRPIDSGPQKQVTRTQKPAPTPIKMIHANLTELKIAPIEVHNDSLHALELPAPAAPIEILSNGRTPLQNGNAEIAQRPQSAGNKSTDADLISTYISALAKRVNDHLIYPNEVKKKQLEGVTLVTFVVTSSGEIKPDSLQIKRSSGSALLDANALKTIESLAPFQKPPREMMITLEIEFAVDY